MPAELTFVQMCLLVVTAFNIVTGAFLLVILYKIRKPAKRILRPRVTQDNICESPKKSS